MPTIAFLINPNTKDVKELGEVHYHTMKEADEELTQQCLEHQHVLKQTPDMRIVFSSKSPLGRYEALMYARYQPTGETERVMTEECFYKDTTDAKDRKMFSSLLNVKEN